MFEILIVEDNPGDIAIVRAALRDLSAPCHLSVAEDGEEAIRMLRRVGDHANAPRPHLILLDINLPILSGHEVLAQVKADSTLRTIPVVMLSSSGSNRDVHQAYQNHANAYVQKPSNMDDYFNVVRLIDSFWFKLAKLPNRDLEGGARRL